ncbi:hypothetical protein Zmor_009675 [Zophobas morio]|uniref:Uncharacterized protein n=1 Tax=Zophobas morio TaxID=2755281 RepID=A0AA38IR18_9CUCU|nr:hypothetical protein Zmor_009675 [Zophobas morio]
MEEGKVKGGLSHQNGRHFATLIGCFVSPLMELPLSTSRPLKMLGHTDDIVYRCGCDGVGDYQLKALSIREWAAKRFLHRNRAAAPSPSISGGGTSARTKGINTNEK